MNNIFFTSDTHFGHENILKPEYEHRPFPSVEKMDEELITYWNMKVTPSDTIYHLGDFAFAKASRIVELLRVLNGRKILISGNHDRELTKAMRDVTTRVAVGVTEYTQYKELKVDGKRLVLFHFPMMTWNHAAHGAIHLHGHSHGNLPDDGYALRFDVGVDAVSKRLSKSSTIKQPHFSYHYRPVSLDEVLSWTDGRGYRAKDHHTGER